MTGCCLSHQNLKTLTSSADLEEARARVCVCQIANESTVHDGLGWLLEKRLICAAFSGSSASRDNGQNKAAVGATDESTHTHTHTHRPGLSAGPAPSEAALVLVITFIVFQSLPPSALASSSSEQIRDSWELPLTHTLESFPHRLGQLSASC